MVLLGILPTAQHVARRLHFRDFHHFESRRSQILVAVHEKCFRTIVIQLVRRRQHGDSLKQTTKALGPLPMTQRRRRRPSLRNKRLARRLTLRVLTRLAF